jgi:hypothetical protein
MDAEARLSVCVVSDLSAAVGVNCCVGLTGGDDLKAARREQRAQPDAESQGEVFLGLAVKPTAGIVTAVGSVKDYD